MVPKTIKKREINPKGDGAPYVKKFNEEYEKMTPEERAKVDEAIAELDELLGPDEEDEEDDPRDNKIIHIDTEEKW